MSEVPLSSLCHLEEFPYLKIYNNTFTILLVLFSGIEGQLREDIEVYATDEYKRRIHHQHPLLWRFFFFNAFLLELSSKMENSMIL